jgi:putative membrane protein
MGIGMGMGWMWLFWLLLLVGVVLLVVVAVRAVGGGVTGNGGGPVSASHRSGRAEELLGERYARGELTTEEYQERLRVLRQGG